jgi:hypothetical protein
MIRTLEEVRARYADPDRQHRDMLGFGSEVLGVHLPEGWQAGHEDNHKQHPLTEAYLLKAARDYLNFAFDKAIDHRGISASRSVTKLREWLWLLGFDEIVAFCDDGRNYTNYGVPILKRVAAALDVPLPNEIAAWPDGAPCTPHCASGCGA